MNKPATTFRDLIVWQKAHAFVLETYRFTRKIPKSERFGLTSQFRRAAISIAANSAEGCKKRGKKDKARYLNIAQGSLEECRYYIILTKDLNYGNTHTLDSKIQDSSRLLEAYTKAILNSDNGIQNS